MPVRVNIIAGQDDDETTSSAVVYNGLDKESSQPQKIIHDFKIENVVEGKTEFYVSPNDDNYYVKSATLNGTDLLANPIELKEGENLRNVQIVLAKDVGKLKGVVLDETKSPAKKAEFALVPVDAVKRKNPSFYRYVTTGEDGEFEIKAPPFEYAVVFYGKDKPNTKGEELDRWIDEAVKNAVKVTIRPDETEKVSLTLPR